MNGESRVINRAKVVGAGYKDFWETKKRYRVVKGGRGSKKSTTVALNLIYNMMKYYHKYDVMPCALVIRRFYNTHKDSTFAQLKWAINRLGVADKWLINTSPIRLTYKPSGQTILFRGMDDPDSVTSITVEKGNLCWVWIEEAFQLESEQAFNKVDMSIRGELPYPLYTQLTLSLNPWSVKTWIKKRFFDNPCKNTWSGTKNYDCNEFLSEDDIALFEEMRKFNPKRFNVEGRGEWGISEGLIFDNWEERRFNWRAMLNETDIQGNPTYSILQGLDFGYSTSPTAGIRLLHKKGSRFLYIFDEIYQKKLSNDTLVEKLIEKEFHTRRLYADSEDPKTISELKKKGINTIKKASKPQGSVNAGIHKLQDFRIIVHSNCKNTIMELNNYVWAIDQVTGEPLNKPIKEFDHLMDALRYATFDIKPFNFKYQQK